MRGTNLTETYNIRPQHFTKLTIPSSKTFFVGSSLDETELQEYTKLLAEFQDIFAWSHEDLTGIDPAYGEHQIDLKEGSAPVRQRQYRLNP